MAPRDPVRSPSSQTCGICREILLPTEPMVVLVKEMAKLLVHISCLASDLPDRLFNDRGEADSPHAA